jgi:hypothetical protein
MYKYIRDYMESLSFTEVATPILANSSPEGARDFLIPSRLHAGQVLRIAAGAAAVQAAADGRRRPALLPAGCLFPR